MATVYRNLQEQVYENAKDIEDLQTNKVDSNEVVSIVTPVIDDKISKINTLSTNKADLHVADTGYISLRTVNAYNSNEGEKVRGLSYYGNYLEYVQYEGLPDSTYKYTLPTKSGTLALVEDIPVNTGYIKAHTIENDAEKNYTTTINLGSGNSGSTLSLQAPGDNGIATLELANEYNQGSTAIKFTADKLVFGNTEITEQQLQQLLQLIQNQ